MVGGAPTLDEPLFNLKSEVEMSPPIEQAPDPRLYHGQHLRHVQGREARRGMKPVTPEQSLLNTPSSTSAWPNRWPTATAPPRPSARERHQNGGHRGHHIRPRSPISNAMGYRISDSHKGTGRRTVKTYAACRLPLRIWCLRRNGRQVDCEHRFHGESYGWECRACTLCS
jgi:hypothetical protein